MTQSCDFELLRRDNIPEFGAVGRHYRHRLTGAEVFSVNNTDRNRAFGLAFKTPPDDSSGIQHILEHLVFCGSRKYPGRDTFVELLRDSFQIFLNAFTYFDSTSFLYANPNSRDFYHCMDVILDAVFFPCLSAENFMVEGWRYEYDAERRRLGFAGAVYSEMKAYRFSRDVIINNEVRKSLFPDSCYRHHAGGVPEEIVTSSFDKVQQYHRDYYQPANSIVFLYGDLEDRHYLRLLNEYFSHFDESKYQANISLQPPLAGPIRLTRSFPAGSSQEPLECSILLNWVLGETDSTDTVVMFLMLESILTGMSASPLKQALLDSGLGDSITGTGLNLDLRQPYYSIRVNGVAPANVGAVEPFIRSELQNISNGLDQSVIEASLNRIEFQFREGGNPRLPRGVQLALWAVSAWLYDNDLFERLAIDSVFGTLRSKSLQNKRLFQDAIADRLVHSPHQSVLTFKPDPKLLQQAADREARHLKSELQSLEPHNLERIIAFSKTRPQTSLRVESPESTPNAPRLRRRDLTSDLSLLPDVQVDQIAGLQLLLSDTGSNDIVYFTVGLDVHALPVEQIPYARLLTRAVLQLATTDRSPEALSSRMHMVTGGIRSGFLSLPKRNENVAATWVFLAGQCLATHIDDLTDLMAELLLHSVLDDRVRIRRLLSDEVRQLESRVMSVEAHKFLKNRLGAHFCESGWAREQLAGFSYLFFLRSLLKRLDRDWSEILASLETTRESLVNRCSMVANVSAPPEIWPRARAAAGRLGKCLPQTPGISRRWEWKPPSNAEAFILPIQLGSAGKAVNLFSSAKPTPGSAYVLSHMLWSTWLWNKIRGEGGAYEAYCSFEDLSGVLTMISSRDPHPERSLETFGETANFVRSGSLTPRSLDRFLVGAIRKYDRFRSPQVKAHTVMADFLTGIGNDQRRTIMAQICGTTRSELVEFGSRLRTLQHSDIVKIVGPSTQIKRISAGRGANLEVHHIL